MKVMKSRLFPIVILLARIGVAQNTFPATGNVGIGTTSPDSLLGVGNSNIGNSFHSMVGGGYAGLFENIYPGYGGSAILLWANSANQNPDSYHFVVEGNNNPELVVQGSGNVGIGTSSPSSTLDIASGSVVDNGQVYTALTLQPAGGAAYAANGSRVLLDSLTNNGIRPVASIWSALGVGGDGGVNYNGSLVLGTTSQGNTAPAERARIDGYGNLGVGTNNPGAKLEVNGNIKLSSGSGASMIFPDGSVQSTAWTGTLCGGDYAESVDVSDRRTLYEPGDLIVIDPSAPGKFLKSAQAYSTLVAGIYSTKPGMVGRRQQGDPKVSAGEIAHGDDRHRANQGHCRKWTNQKWRSARHVFTPRPCNEGD